MKKLLTLGLLALLFTSCNTRFNTRFNGDYESRFLGLKKVCPNCTFYSHNWSTSNDVGGTTP